MFWITKLKQMMCKHHWVDTYTYQIKHECEHTGVISKTNRVVEHCTKCLKKGERLG